MGACASKFTVLKNASDAPPPAVKNEVEQREVNPAEQVAVKKDDAALVEDDASHRQSLGHLLGETEEKKGAVDSNCSEVKPEAVADDAPAPEESKTAPIANVCQNVAMEPAPVQLESKNEVETLKVEKPVEIPEALQVEKSAEATNCEAPETEKPSSDAEKKETDEKLTECEVIETPEKKPEVAEAETKDAEAEKPEKTADTEKEEEEDKPAENDKVETSESVEDKHVLEPQTAESCSGEEPKPSSDAEKPQAEEDKVTS